MSAKHHKRTRARILAKRAKPAATWIILPVNPHGSFIPTWRSRLLALQRQVHSPAWRHWARLPD